MPNPPDWSATKYLKFANDRTRPAKDLLVQVPLASPARVVDLGCGPGNSTELLTLRYPQSNISGMDLSPNMLEKAREHLPNIAFELGDVLSYRPAETVDLFFSNAVFQWVPGDQRISVMKRLLEGQPAGSCLALQMPDVAKEPCHTSILDTALDERWKDMYQKHIPVRDPLPTSHELYNAFSLSCSSVNVWYTLYEHQLESHMAILDWFKETGLRPFLEPLDENQQAEFMKEYLNRVTAAYPVLEDGSVLIKMPRLFVVLTKK